MMQKKQSNKYCWILMLLLFNLGLKITLINRLNVQPASRIRPLAASAQPVPHTVAIEDTQDYLDLAWNITRRNGFGHGPGMPTAFRAPLYPLFLSLCLSLSQNLYFIKLAQTLLATLTVLLVLLLGNELFGLSAGILAALLLSVYPSQNWWIADIFPETLTAFLLVVMVYALVLARKRGKPASTSYAVLSGIAAGLAVLARPNVLLIFPVLILLYAGYFWLYRREAAMLKIFLVMIPAATLTVIPWTARNYRAFNRFVPVSSNGGINFYVGNSDDAYETRFIQGKAIDSGVFYGSSFGRGLIRQGYCEFEIDRAAYRQGVQFLTSHPGKALRLILDKALSFWKIIPGGSRGVKILGGVSFGFTLLFSLVALYFLYRRKKLITAFPALGVIGGFFLTDVIFWSTGRFRMPGTPFFTLLAGYGLQVVIGKLYCKRR